MSKWRDLVAVALLALMAGPGLAGPLGLGRAALPDEIAAWDRDVRPDGKGLPDGAGSVEQGDEIFAERCAVCHGDFAEGVDNWPSLSGGIGTLGDEDPVKTVGSYWPYLSTLWDYLHRSKPYGNAQSLAVDETYALAAFLLYSSDLVEDDFVLSRGNFLGVVMPNADGFIVDDRAETEYPRFTRAPCMQECRQRVEVTRRASDLGLTPRSEALAHTVDPVLLVVGEKAFKRCKACHQIGEGAGNKTGPALNGIVDAPAGAADGFRYSGAMKKAAKGGLIWTPQELAKFLAKPKAYMKGTKMSFAGIKKEDDIAAVIAYMSSFPG